MKLATNWKDYEVIATGNGEKLERWGEVVLLRPDPQIIWKPRFNLSSYNRLDAIYLRDSKGGGKWKILRKLPEVWSIKYGECSFFLKPMGFKHTGLFPEQAVNWDIMTGLIKKSPTQPKILNLFGYTGGATVMCAKAGASVTHVDAAKNMCERAGENARASGISNIRYIVDDCVKFVEKEIKRGKTYDGILMDPPSYGRGPGGEMWKIEDNLYDLVLSASKLLTDNPLFFLINSYTTGLQPMVMNNILELAMPKTAASVIESYEVGLPTSEDNVNLPCGASAIFYNR